MIVYFDAQMVPGLASGSSLTLPPVCTHILYTLPYFLVSPVAQMVKNQPVMQETQVRFLGREDSLEKGMATHSSILAWRTPWTEEPGKLQFMRLQKVEHS